jgi:DNA-binding MarR family transcriptional regulator
MTTKLSYRIIMKKNMRSSQAYEITWMVRRLFRALGQEADRYLQSYGLTAADRAVMEFLYPDAKLTVPEIAGRYDVSRQHIQVTVNGLLEKAVLRIGANPRHKRSSLVFLTRRGRELFSEIRQNESEIVDRLFAEISDDSLETTHHKLKLLLKQFQWSRRRPADPGWVSRAKRAVPEGSSACIMPSSAAAFRRRREQGSETP